MRLPPTLFILNLIAFAAPAAIVGCDSDDELSARDGRASILADESVRLNAQSRGDNRPAAEPDGEVVADQAERDVDTLLALHDRQTDGRGERGAASAAEDSSGAATSIRWNDPPAARSRGLPPRALPEAGDSPGSFGGLEASELAAAPPLGSAAGRIRVADPPVPGDGTQERLADLLSSDQMDLLLVDLRRALFPQSRQSDQPLRELMLIAATSLVDEETPLNPEAFTDLTDAERELLGKFQSFFIDLRQQLDGSRDAEEAMIESLEKLRKSLIRQPELSLPNALLCWRVGGFGDYDTFDRTSFLAHSEQQVILYLEIDDFTSVRTEQDEWETRIAQQLEIYSDRDHLPVWTEPWQEAVDATTKRRRDFFTTQIVTLPKALSVGRYHLKVRARDDHSGAEAESSIAFEMVADERLAAKAVK